MKLKTLFKLLNPDEVMTIYDQNSNCLTESRRVTPLSILSSSVTKDGVDLLSLEVIHIRVSSIVVDGYPAMIVRVRLDQQDKTTIPDKVVKKSRTAKSQK